VPDELNPQSPISPTQPATHPDQHGRAIGSSSVNFSRTDSLIANSTDAEPLSHSAPEHSPPEYSPPEHGPPEYGQPNLDQSSVGQSGESIESSEPVAELNPLTKSISSPNWPLRYLWLAVLSITSFYVFILPELQIAWWNYRTPNRMLPSALQLDFVTRSMLRTLEASVVAFFFAVGASWGSFLNVVAYRLPKNLDISVAGSRCPNCHKKLSFKENMPIFGWIGLRGRCRGCHIPIPIKYLVAELLLGFLAIWIGAYELLSGGINLPLRTPNFYAGVVWIVFYTKWDLVSYALFHFALFCILSTQILILDNKLPVPKRFIGFTLGLGLTLTACFPWLLLVHSSLFLPGIEVRNPGQFEGVKAEWLNSTRQSVFIGWLYSALVALPTAVAATRICNSRQLKDVLMWLGTFGCLGIWLGWQASLLIALTSTLIGLPILQRLRDSDRKSFYLSLIVLSATVLHHTLWDWLIDKLLSLAVIAEKSVL